MDLNRHTEFKKLDPENMLAHIDGLPAQLLSAWKLGLTLPLPEMSQVSRIVVAGMGGSAIGADLLASYLSDRLSVPVFIHRDYALPAFAQGRDTLVVISSHSGNTEESLSAFEAALRSHCQLVTVSTGGKLQQSAQAAGMPSWIFEHVGQPRTAVGFSFGLLLALLVRLGLLSDPGKEVEETVNAMIQVQTRLGADVPVEKNPAKRMAGQLVGRHVTIFGSAFMATVARRWKCQLNEVSKAIASFEALPEADHNTLAGICNPEEILKQEFALFLQASSDHPRNQTRVERTREIMMLEGIGTDLIDARGDGRLAQMWTTLLFGDYVSFYLAMLYDTDPTPIPSITALKEGMAH